MTNTNDTTNSIEPPVVFNMDLANGPTSVRFCYEAADVLGVDPYGRDLHVPLEDDEFTNEIVDEWGDALERAGYYVRWDAGDVVVWDLRTLTNDEREAFYAQEEN